MMALVTTKGVAALPAKEQQQFRTLVKLFEESKQFKKSLKIAEGILKKFPQHGETLSMKALVLSKFPDRRAEAFESAKQGLRHNVGSHLCWYVLALLNRSEKDYTQAAKCYRHALRHDPDNIQTLRELSSVEIQLRLLESFRETRRKLLSLKGGIRLNWTSLATAQHLCGNLSGAIGLLEQVEKCFPMEADDQFDVGELFMYKASLLEESEDYERCLEYVKQKEEKNCITDVMGLYEMKGRVSLKLGDLDGAQQAYRMLIKKLPDNESYILCLMVAHDQFWDIVEPSQQLIAKEKIAQVEDRRNSQESPPDLPAIRLAPWIANTTDRPSWGWLEKPRVKRLDGDIAVHTYRWGNTRRTYRTLATERVTTNDGTEVTLNEEQQNRVLQFFEELRLEHPKCDQLERLPLRFLSGDIFKRHLDRYLRSKIRKGVPSIFINLKLLQSPGNTPIIAELLESYVHNLEKELPTFGDPSDADDKAPDVEEPFCLVFAYMLLIQQRSFMGQRSIDLIEKAIIHTPTVPELYVLKGRYYKHTGAYREASDAYEQARDMDLADRHLNTKSVKHLLKINDLSRAQTIAQMFSKQSDQDGSTDMQCMWYALEVGSSHRRQGEHGQALKKFRSVLDHFSTMIDDQIDFHIYSLRALVLRRYTSFLKMHDKLFSHDFYRTAAKSAAEIYLDMYDGKILREKPEAKEKLTVKDLGDMEAAERKKLKNKMRKQARKEGIQSQSKRDDEASDSKKDSDRDGRQFFLECDPLKEATILSEVFHSHCSCDIHALELAYQVHFRRGKQLRMLNCITLAWKLCDNMRFHPVLSPMICHFLKNANFTDIPDDVACLMFKKISTICGIEALSCVEDLRTGCEAYLDTAMSAFNNTAEVHMILGSLASLQASDMWTEPRIKAIKDALSVAFKRDSQTGPTLGECEELVNYLGQQKNYIDCLSEVKVLCAARFPSATF